MVSDAIALAHQNQQLREQIERLKQTLFQTEAQLAARQEYLDKEHELKEIYKRAWLDESTAHGVTKQSRHRLARALRHTGHTRLRRLEQVVEAARRDPDPTRRVQETLAALDEYETDGISSYEASLRSPRSGDGKLRS